jgi:DNA primase
MKSTSKPAPRAANLAAAMASMLASAGIALAQGGQPATNPPQEKSQEAKPAQESKPADEAKPQQPAQPSLDELLGLEPSTPRDTTRPPAQDPAQAALERKLANQQASEAFLQAVQLMDETALRLERSRDTGITTQRMQEEIVRKLDIMIAQAQRQRQQRQQQQQQSSSSQDPQDQPDQQSQQQQAQQPGSEPASDTQVPPGRQGEQLNPEVARGAAWGALPARMRDALLQGNSDKYSSTYQKWTEAYYRKLAEEAGK